MATTKFVPQIWSAKILDSLDKALVYNKLFNTDYEGEITEAGDTVHIGSIGKVTVKPYTKGSAIAAPDAVNVEEQTLVIDKAEYFNVSVDDVDAAQSKANLIDGATTEAGNSFADSTDQYLASVLAAKGGVKLGTTAAPITITKENAYDTLIDLKVKLDKANLPKAGRVCVVPAEFEGYMLRDPRFVAVSGAGEQRLTEGTVYRAAGFEIQTSNNAPSPAANVFTVIAGSPVCGTFANQVLKTEAYRPTDRFADAVKGLHVYGATVTRPNAVGLAYVKFTA